MKKLLCFFSITLMIPFLITPAHAQIVAPEQLPQSSGPSLGVDLLSDTKGIDMSSYTRTLISDLKKHWTPLATDGPTQPLKSQEETLITLSIAPDGHISAMQIEDSTHNAVLDKTAWNATKATACPPLPAGINDSNLKLRIHFLVN
jgi:TonB family protein